MPDVIPRQVHQERVLLLQYAGDFREAARLLERTGEEVYAGHAYLLQTLGSIAEDVGWIGIACCNTNDAYEERLPSGAWVVGIPADPYRDFPGVIAAVDRLRPTRVVLLLPHRGLLRALRRRKIPTFCILADSFDRGRARDRLRHVLLARELNQSNVRWVANHGQRAVESLIRIGVRREKVSQWDWPHPDFDDSIEPRQLEADGTPHLFYAGLVSEAKGVGDLLRAFARLAQHHRSATLRIAGDGDVAAMRALSESLGVDRGVTFLGRIPHRDVLNEIDRSTALVVPSRHEYPEGFPLTIYEGLQRKKPVVCSDHPMFRHVMEDGVTASVFQAGNHHGLAQRIEDLHGAQEAVTYTTLVRNSRMAWDRLQVDLKWGDLARDAATS